VLHLHSLEEAADHLQCFLSEVAPLPEATLSGF